MNDLAHHHIEELLAADALDGLDEQGRQDLERSLADHDPGCAECARLRRAYAEVAASFALSLDPVPMSAGAEDRVIAAARAGAATGEGATPDQEDGAAPPIPLAPRRRGFRVAAVALGAAACLVAAGMVGFVLHQPTPGSEVVAAYMAQGDVHTAKLVSGSTEMTLYYRPGETAALVQGTGFADPPGGHVYELWYRPAGSSQMSPGAIFVPTGGSVVAPASVSPEFTAVAVSVEPGYQPSPTGKVVLSGGVQGSG